MKGRGNGRVAAIVVGAVALVVAVWPGAFVVGEVVRGLARGGDAALPVRLSAGALGNTILVALLIGGLAMLIGLPAAWAARRVPARGFLLYMVPMLMPSYLAYIGWGLLRAPGTVLGDFLMRGPEGVGSGGAGGNWYPVVAAKVFAVGGLVLWSWPLAAVVMGAAFRRIDQGVLDGLRLESARWRRVCEVVWMARGGVAAGVGAVALVMLGSAVPLHVSQMETYAVEVWRALDEVAPGERWRVWGAAWPLVVIAVGVGVWIGRMVVGTEGGETDPLRRRRGRVGGAAIGAMIVWGLSVVVPIGLLIANLRGWGSVAMFWRISSGAFWWSAGIAACVGVVGLLMAGSVWLAWPGRGSERPFGAVFRVACTALLIAGLMPGVLVGSATARAWDVTGLRWVGDSAAIVVIGHVARFGFLAVLAGWLLARGEPRELWDMRAMDSGGSVKGWVLAALPPQAGMLLGAGVAVGLLSFHEIEATVMVQPPTSAGGGFAWKVLQALHFSREEDLIPAMLIVMGVGLGAALVAVTLLGIRPTWGRRASE